MSEDIERHAYVPLPVRPMSTDPDRAVQQDRCAECYQPKDHAIHHTVIETASAAYDSALATWRDAPCGHRVSRDDGFNYPPLGDGCSYCGAYWEACETFRAAVEAWDQADRAAHPEDYTAPGGRDYDRPVARAAVCTVCKFEFNPQDDTDLIHIVTEAPDPDAREVYCGGRGEMIGRWF